LPTRPMVEGRSGRSATRTATSLCALGSANATAGGQWSAVGIEGGFTDAVELVGDGIGCGDELESSSSTTGKRGRGAESRRQPTWGRAADVRQRERVATSFGSDGPDSTRTVSEH